MCLKDYQEIIQFFDEKSLHWHFSEKDLENAHKILSLIGNHDPKIILDVGCGTGELYPFLKRKYPNAKIIGMDLSVKMLNRVNYQYDLLLLGNAEEMPLLNGSVDLVLNYCVFPHFVDKIKAIGETFRILKPDGHYYIIHPDGRYITDKIHQQQKPVPRLLHLRIRQFRVAFLPEWLLLFFVNKKIEKQK